MAYHVNFRNFQAEEESLINLVMIDYFCHQRCHAASERTRQGRATGRRGPNFLCRSLIRRYTTHVLRDRVVPQESFASLSSLIEAQDSSMENV